MSSNMLAGEDQQRPYISCIVPNIPTSSNDVSYLALSSILGLPHANSNYSHIARNPASFVYHTCARHQGRENRCTNLTLFCSRACSGRDLERVNHMTGPASRSKPSLTIRRYSRLGGIRNNLLWGLKSIVMAWLQSCGKY